VEAVSAPPTPGRALGVDLGERRIGLALSDDRRTVATPHSVLARSTSRADDHREIVAAAHDAGATVVVVGLPLSLSGATGPAARAVLAEVDELRAAAGEQLSIVVHDERLTTLVAEQALREARMRRDARKRVVDKVAATVMLQSFLDTAR